jgi:hypothetical protein
MTTHAAPAADAKRSRLFRPTEPLYPDWLRSPRFADPHWDFVGVSDRESLAERRVDFESVPAPWRLLGREVLAILAQPDHPRATSAGVVLKAKPAAPSALINLFYELRTIASWATNRGHGPPHTWLQPVTHQLLDDLRRGTHRPNGRPLKPSSVRSYCRLVQLFWDLAPALTDGGLSFLPWHGQSAARVAGDVAPVENSTAPLAWDSWSSAVAAAWRIVNEFSTDILGAVATVNQLPPTALGPTGNRALGIFLEWVDAGGKVPLRTGVGRDSGTRGEPNVNLLCRQLGINSGLFNRATNSHRPQAIDLLHTLAADPETSRFGGVFLPTVVVEDDDGRAHPWVAEIGLGETEFLTSVLRGAAYIVLAALTGMRDSELQSLTREAVTTSDGLPAVSGRQFKARHTFIGQERAWWAPAPVLKTLEVLSELTPHPTHLFARSSNNIGAYDPQRDIARVLSFVNDPPDNRPGRGRGLGLEPVPNVGAAQLNQTSLRRSFSVYAARYPGAELGLGIQLGHAALRMTAGYSTDSQQHAARLFDDDRRRMARDQVARLVHGADTATGGGARRTRSFVGHVLTDPDRAERLIDTLAEEYHMGIFNDCLYDPTRAACGTTGPQLADKHCAAQRCGNAVFRASHLPALEDHVDRLTTFLDEERGHPSIRTSMARERAVFVSLIADISTGRVADLTTAQE